MFTIRKKMKFEMAHQLHKAYSKDCKDTIHGHSYILEVYLQGEYLDKTGMVMDFGEMKAMSMFVHEKYDHALVMPEMFDLNYLKALELYNKKFMVVKYNPTAEEMARDIFKQLKVNVLHSKIKLLKIRLHETTSGWAEYSE